MLKLLKRTTARTVLNIFLISLIVEGIAAWAFSRIPSARAYIPMQLTSSAQVYDWTPDRLPAGFRFDDPSISEASYFRRSVEPLIKQDETRLEQYVAIMNWVRSQVRVKDAYSAIPGDPITVHKAVLNGTPAQCGNLASLMVSASTSVGLTEVRTWHLLADDGPGAEGHVANEVWIPELSKWVFLDPMNNTYVLLDGIPASLLEVREIVLTRQEHRLTPITGPNAHTPPDGLFDLYRNVMVVPALAAAHTPLSSSYRPLNASRLAAIAPDVGGLRSVIESMVRLATGESRLLVLVDDIARAHSYAYPVWQAKALFALLVCNGGVLLLLVIWLLIRAAISIRFILPERTLVSSR